MAYDIVVGRTDADRKNFGIKGTIFLGRHYVKMGETVSLSNRVLLDVARTHVILVSGKRGCLIGNTKVLTDSGYKKIKDFDKFKDRILTFNKETKNFGYSNASLLKYKLKNESLIKLKLEDNSVIKATNEHPLLIRNNDNLKWDEVKNIKEGAFLIGKEKNSENIIYKKIKEISKINNIKEVYDLMVPLTHSFIANDIISHNSGKSYSLSVMAEEMAKLPEDISKNLAILMFDTMGVFWTMKYPNERDEHLLEKWGLKPQSLKINLYVPEGYYQKYKDRGLPADFSFSIKTSELSADDWCGVFGITLTDSIGVLIERTLEELREEMQDRYDIDDIIDKIRKNKKVLQTVKDAAENRFVNAKSWGLFNIEGTEISGLLKRGEISVLDTSAYTQVSGAWSIKSLVLGIIARKLLTERIVSRRLEELENIETSQRYLIDVEKELEKPLIWLFIDELQEFLPKEGSTPATSPLMQLLREGRQPGISLVMATQQPGEVHKDVLTQSDIVLSHRLTAKADVEALNSMMQSYLLAEIQDYMNGLPNDKGAAIILDDNSERIYPIAVRPKLSWHGGEAPSAVKFSKKEELKEL